jgi:hypothetical protein
MRNPRRKPLLGLMIIGFSFVLGLPAVAAPRSPSTVRLLGGSLSITAPTATVNLGSGLVGSTLAASLGTVTVTDSRGGLLTSWAGSVSSTSLTTGGGAATQTIPAAAINYLAGTVTAKSGVGIDLPGTGGPMSGSQVTYTSTAGLGNETVSWKPTITVTVPTGIVVGTYSATITHSVA